MGAALVVSRAESWNAAQTRSECAAFGDDRVVSRPEPRHLALVYSLAVVPCLSPPRSEWPPADASDLACRGRGVTPLLHGKRGWSHLRHCRLIPVGRRALGCAKKNPPLRSGLYC